MIGEENTIYADGNPTDLFRLFSIKHDLQKFLDNGPISNANSIFRDKTFAIKKL
jgi:hypothetical protein